MKVKNMKVLAILIIAMLMLGVNVQAAAYSFKATVAPTSAELKPGEEVTVTVKVSDINMGENGINALEGTLKYDTNIFESVKEDDLNALNNWSVTYNDEATALNGKFMCVTLSAGTKEDVQVLSVKLKVKENVKKSTTTKIDFVDLTSNSGGELVNVGTKSVNVSINVPGDNSGNEGGNQNGNGSGNQNGNGNGTQNGNGNAAQGGSQNGSSSTAKPIKPTDNSATGKLPQTGESHIVIVAVATIAIAGVYIAIRYRLLRDVK